MMDIRKYASIGLLFVLGGCGVPSGMATLSYAMTGVSYASSGKGIADHAWSAAVEQDCAMLRAVQGNDICRSARGDAGDLMTMIDLAEPPKRGQAGASSRPLPVTEERSWAKDHVVTSVAAGSDKVGSAAPLDAIYGPAR